MANLASLTVTDNNTVNVTALLAAAMGDFIGGTFKLNVAKPAVSLKSTIANNAVGGADTCMASIFTITASGTQAIDLTNFTDISGVAAQSFTRVKYLMIRLLSTGDDPTGTAASSITIQPGAANAWVQIIDATAHTVTIVNGGYAKFYNPSAAGWPVDATHKTLTITNVDGALSAHVQFVAIGGST